MDDGNNARSPSPLLPSKVPSTFEDCAKHLSIKTVLRHDDPAKSVKAVDFMRALYDHLPPAGAAHLLSDCIHQITNEGASLDAFIQDLFDGFALPFRRTGRASSVGPPSVYSPQPDIAAAREERITQLLQESLDVGQKGQRAFRELLLVRHDAKCPVSGRIDHSSISALSKEEQELEDALERFGELLFVTNEAAHIAPLRWVTDAGEAKLEQKGRLWARVERYFGLNVANRMSDLNAARNGLLLSPGVHASFDRLETAFEAVEGQPGYYTVILFRRPQEKKTKIVHLPQANGVEGPDPSLLAMHLAICRVLRASGAAEAIDAFYDDLETTSVLSDDKAGLLMTALSMAQYTDRSP